MSTYSSSQVSTALNAVFDLGLDKKYYQLKELNKKFQGNLSIQHISEEKKWRISFKIKDYRHFLIFELSKTGL